MRPSCRCKLCGEEAIARYILPETTIFACPCCDLHFTGLIDDLSPKVNGHESTSLDARGRCYIEERLPAAAAILDSRLDLLRKYLDIRSCRCLDVGAGCGQFLAHLAASGGKGQGIEPSGLRRQFAAEKFGLQLHPELIEDSFWQENFRDYFDAVTLWEVIEHVNDPQATVCGACRLLKPEGLLFLETHSRQVPAYRFSEWCYHWSGGRIPLFLCNFFPPIPFGHKQIFTPEQLTSLVQQNGFAVIHKAADFPGPPVPILKACDKIILVARKIVCEKVQAVTNSAADGKG